MTKQQGLGRGLGSLIPNKGKANGAEKVIEVPINKIKANPWQPRDNFADNALQDLVGSIKEHGILQPLIVTEKNDEYELIAGERRLRAAKLLKLKTVPALIRQAEEQQKLELALVENLHREDLNALEKAVALRKLIDQFDYTQEQVAKKVSMSRTAVANLLRLLNLPDEIKTALHDNKISEGHARALLSVKDEKEQVALFKKIKLGNWTVRDVEGATRQITEAGKRAGKIRKDQGLMRKEEELERALSTKVSIKKKGQKGQVVIQFFSEEELESLIKKLKS